MACLSVRMKDARGHGVVANPIFLTSSIENLVQGSVIPFEVMEQDAGSLNALVNEPELYSLGTEVAFFGKLRSLEAKPATVSALAILGRPTLHATIDVFVESGSVQ